MSIVTPRDLSSPAVRHVLLPGDAELLAKMAWHHVSLLRMYDEGSSYEEMAHAVGVPVGTVKSRLHRARAMLEGRRAAARIINERKTPCPK